jgi:hypothetical protein
MHSYSKERYLTFQSFSKNCFMVLVIVFLLMFFISDWFIYLLFPLVAIFFSFPSLAIFRIPWISQAWLSGLAFNLFPATPWHETPIKIKVLIFITSMLHLSISVGSISFYYLEVL